MIPLRRQHSGQVVILAVFSMLALIGICGVVVDVGVLYSTRRQMQTAADAAAIAGANALQTSQSSNYQVAATDVAGLDGFSNGQNGVTVTVAPPATDPGPATLSYVEVNITQSVPMYFLRVLGYNNFNVSTQAIAGTVNGPACIYALDPSASDAVYLNGNININSSCGLIDDSSSSTGLYANGNGTIQTTSIGVVGNYNSTSLGNMIFSPTPKTNIAPVPDPLAAVQEPTVPTCTEAATTVTGTKSISGIQTTVNLTPAVYSGGISSSGAIITTLNFATGTYGNGISFTGAIITNADFNPGQYQNGGGSGAAITLNGNNTVNFASGTYTFCGPLSISGNVSVTLQPGLYYGGISITGNNTVTFEPGTYILAGGGLSVTGNSTLSGTGITFYNTSGLGGYTPINLTGNETANFSAPTSGPLKGMLFFQDRSIAYSSSNGSTVEGNSSSTFNGAVYFPTTNLTYLGNSSSSGYTFLIADKISIVGNSELGDNYTLLTGGSPVASSTLYE
ncbi:MAG: pilus assembly protein TadG-related protein [Candidatus Binataceae bacterium]